jgi:cytoskeletal protein RodZ
MPGFGEQLRQEREGRGISLAAMSAETKVQARYFEALERDELQELPGGVFRKGILRAYLGALGLDEGLWMQRFDQLLAEQARRRGEDPGSQEEAWVTFATNVKRNRIPQRSNSHWRWAGVAALLAVIVAGGWALWVLELRRLVAK